ncbi:testis-expressed protein 13D [Manis javanica]|uniref:testis-expressed protein 13D n=1 Tax=Manis javanica TaxID=9974 RepID=UPI003C6DB0C0
MTTQLNRTGATLQKVLFVHDVLRGQLFQLERSAQFAPLTHETLPGSPPEQLGATAGPLIAGQQIDTMAMGMHTRLFSEVQIPAPADALNVPGSLNPWAQAMQPPLPMGVPNAVPFYALIPVAVSFLPSLPPARAAVRPLQMPPLGISPSGPRASEGFQEEIAPLCYQRSYMQEEGCRNIQYIVPLENIRNLSYNENLQRSQGMAPLMESVSLETGTENPQEMITLGAGSSQSQEEGPQKPQVTSLGDSWSFGMRENQKNQQPLGQNEPKGKKASDSQCQEKLASGSSPGNWDCQRCKACYKCRKVRRPFESGGLDPGKTH